MSDHVELELELRRLPGVSFVGFDERNGELLVQILAAGVRTDSASELRSRAERIARAHVVGPVRVMIDADAPGHATERDRDRVQLLAVVPSPDDAEIEVHLSFRTDRTVGRGRAGLGPAEAATATIFALRALGLDVPYTVSAASGLASEEGDAVVVVLSAPEGKRYGVATGMNHDEAAARATLHALNRSLRRAPRSHVGAAS